MEIVTKSAEETKASGREIAGYVIANKLPKIIALVGNLGSGKTTFTQGFAEGMRIDRKILSPTFILMRTYSLEGPRFKYFYHIDLYRLEEGIKQELDNLGITDILKDESSITIIEWAEKAREYLPQDTFWIEFEQIDDDQRRITTPTE